MGHITSQTYSFTRDENAPKPAAVPETPPAPPSAFTVAAEQLIAHYKHLRNIPDSVLARLRPNRSTTEMYERLLEPDPTTEAPVLELPSPPPSLFPVAAAAIIAQAEKLTPAARAVRTGPTNIPLPMQHVFAKAHALGVEAAACGDDAAKVAAAKAQAAADALYAAWQAGKTPPAPPAPPAPERVAAEDHGEHTAGRPHVGDVVHLDSEVGTCRVAFVVEILNGAPNAAVVVTAENPYLRIADVADASRPVFARWIPRPVKDPTPGMRKPITSWHRGTPQECPGWSK